MRHGTACGNCAHGGRLEMPAAGPAAAPLNWFNSTAGAHEPCTFVSAVCIRSPSSSGRRASCRSVRGLTAAGGPAAVRGRHDGCRRASVAHAHRRATCALLPFQAVGHARVPHAGCRRRTGAATERVVSCPSLRSVDGRSDDASRSANRSATKLGLLAYTRVRGLGCVAARAPARACAAAAGPRRVGHNRRCARVATPAPFNRCRGWSQRGGCAPLTHWQCCALCRVRRGREELLARHGRCAAVHPCAM
jgi:hypothetical protein